MVRIKVARKGAKKLERLETDSLARLRRDAVLARMGTAELERLREDAEQVVGRRTAGMGPWRLGMLVMREMRFCLRVGLVKELEVNSLDRSPRLLEDLMVEAEVYRMVHGLPE